MRQKRMLGMEKLVLTRTRQRRGCEHTGAKPSLGKVGGGAGGRAEVWAAGWGSGSIMGRQVSYKQDVPRDTRREIKNTQLFIPRQK